MSADFGVHTCRWRDAERELRLIRHTVFVVEQCVPESLEWDDADETSLHARARSASGKAIGCARLLPDAHIGRVAVLAKWRRRGVGSALLLRLIDEARTRGHARVLLNAQVDAMPFYARYEFVGRGDVFDEAGIPHRAMELVLGSIA
jgi:predicted GNAT family N-acyltransferase